MRAGLPTDGWKKTLDNYERAALKLFESMAADGFDERYPVPVDPDGELLGGSHRVACALALEIAEVPVVRAPQYVWAPPWDRTWFEKAGLPAPEIKTLEAILETLR